MNNYISFPELGPNDTNNAMGLHAKYGIQMIGMCYQNYDSNLEFYEEYFAEKAKLLFLNLLICVMFPLRLTNLLHKILLCLMQINRLKRIIILLTYKTFKKF